MFAINHQLQSGEVHIWHHRADDDDFIIASKRNVLSNDEKQRASSMSHQDRRLYISSRVRLRQLLSGYTGIRAEQIRFSYGDKGKPDLQSHGLRGALHFNTSHSGRDVVHAISHQRLGVDVEQLRTSIPWATARLAFSANELESLMSTSEDAQARHFFSIWTKKEAYVKAHGGRRMFRQFGISTAAEIRSRILFDTIDPYAGLSWSLYRLDQQRSCIAALAVEGAQHRIRQFSVDAVSLAA